MRSTGNTVDELTDDEADDEARRRRRKRPHDCAWARGAIASEGYLTLFDSRAIRGVDNYFHWRAIPTDVECRLFDIRYQRRIQASRA